MQKNNAHTKTPRAGYAFAVAGVATVTLVQSPFRDSGINATTVALVYLLVVLGCALWFGSKAAVLAALLSVACFNFFFLPPHYTFIIDDPQNWVALLIFLITALTVGQLSARAQAQAVEAERRRAEIERLYGELQTAFEQASEAEALRRSEQLKSALLDAVTHDLRTPLTSIKAAVTTLLKEDDLTDTSALDSEGQHEMLEVIDEETDRLNRFIEDMMELARIEAGALLLQRHWGALEEIIATVRERAAALTARHQVVVNLADNLPVIRVDAKAVAQVLFTLLENAAKYAPPGTIIRIAAQQPADLVACEMIRVSVEDEGPGVPPALRERVFDKFFRVTTPVAAQLPRTAGTGMGLAIARGIVAAHGGRIWIENGAGDKGLRVVFTLPIGDNEDA